MHELLGTHAGVFLGLTVTVMGFAAYMTGQALANTWKPLWQAMLYCVLLGFGDRFLTFALFDGELLSFTGLFIASAVLVAMTAASHRLIQARKMVSQYPWLYESEGLFNWRERGSGT